MLTTTASQCDVATDYTDAAQEWCKAQSSPYTVWPSCRECGDHCCPQHSHLGSLRSEDEGESATVVCTTCHALGLDA